MLVQAALLFMFWGCFVALSCVHKRLKLCTSRPYLPDVTVTSMLVQAVLLLVFRACLVAWSCVHKRLKLCTTRVDSRPLRRCLYKQFVALSCVHKRLKLCTTRVENRPYFSEFVATSMLVQAALLLVFFGCLPEFIATSMLVQAVNRLTVL